MVSKSETYRGKERNLYFLLLLFFLCLVPFVNKPFHIDDPLFIWVAKQIQLHPLDFYGFDANWYGTAMPMAEITKNPPLASYYLAGVASLFGWSEPVLHVALFVPALVAVWGSYRLAGLLCPDPLLATCAGLMTPVFLLSSTTVMCDVMMLASWVWGLFFWIRGMRAGSRTDLLAASFLAAAGALTKYFGASLILLYAAYSLAQKRRFTEWLFFLLIPVTLLLAYEAATGAMYGRGLFSDAASYATTFSLPADITLGSKLLIGLSFIGGCLATSFFYFPLLWTKKAMMGVVPAMAALIAGLSFGLQQNGSMLGIGGSMSWAVAFQVSLLAVAGLNFIAVALADVLREKSPDALLIFLWVLGTVCFASVFNWTVNGRSILPLAPVCGIIVARKLDSGLNRGMNKYLFYLPLLPGLLLSLLVTYGDYRLAESVRNAANTILNRYGRMAGTIWYQGHWGFQHYMEAGGGRAVDYVRPKLLKGDVVVIPANNSNTRPLPEGTSLPLGKVQVPVAGFFQTMSQETGAGFYSHVWGPLPFTVGPGPDEEYRPYILTRDITGASPGSPGGAAR